MIIIVMGIQIFRVYDFLTEFNIDKMYQCISALR